MRIDILSLFPAIAQGALAESIMGKAQQRGLVEVRHWNLRAFAAGKHSTTDDTPYGGGQGMVMKCEPIFAAVEAVLSEVEGRKSTVEGGPANPSTGSGQAVQRSTFNVQREETSAERTKSGGLRPRIVLLSPGGRVFQQAVAAEYAALPHLILICGHYEGVDQRVIDHLVDEELSIGDYVLTNGALAAAVVVDAVTRLLPGVLGDACSAVDESFAAGLLEYPQYTRPAEFRGWRVPEILLSGHHAEIARWRREQARAKTRRIRPDLRETPPADQKLG